MNVGREEERKNGNEWGRDRLGGGGRRGDREENWRRGKGGEMRRKEDSGREEE